MTTRTARLAPSWAAPFALLLAVACGSGGGGDPQGRLRDAAGATRDAGTARLAVTVTTGPTTSFSAEGTVDLAAGRGTLTLDLAVAGLGRVDALFDGSEVYARNPAGALPGMRPWVGTTLAQLATVIGLDAGGLGPVETAGLTAGLDYLRGATAATEVGTEILRGTATTRYRASIDLAQAAEGAPPEVAPDLQAAAAAGTTVPDADIWLDDEGRVRRVDLTVAASGGGAGPTTLSVELYDFGTPVEVEIPPPAQVGSLVDLLGGY